MRTQAAEERMWKHRNESITDYHETLCWTTGECGKERGITRKEPHTVKQPSDRNSYEVETPICKLPWPNSDNREWDLTILVATAKVAEEHAASAKP